MLRHSTIKIMLLAFFVLLLALSPALAAEPEYVGWEACAMCHKDETADWQRSKHAKAFELLKPDKRRKAKKDANIDPNKDHTGTSEKCVGCHTTGYREPGGFVDVNTTPNMIGVQCEMCHGPGSEYRKLHKSKRTKFTRDEARAAGQVYGSVDEAVCKRCHGHKDAPMQPRPDGKYSFVLSERLKDSQAFHKLYDLIGTHK